MTDPLSPSRGTDSHSPNHEVKPALLHTHDDPLQSHAHEWHKAEEEQRRALPKPISIPRSLFDDTKDPEATPTAANAFPSTPTSSSSSLHKGRSPDRPDDTGVRDDNAFGKTQATISNELSSEIIPTKPLSQSTSIAGLRTKVCKAAARGDLDTLVDLLHASENGDSDPDYPSSFALVNSSTASGLTPLLEAASHGHLDVVRHLISEEGAVRDLEDTEGENAFLKASYRGHLDIMKYLAEGEDGTDVNVADRQGWTALHNACSKGYLEVAMWLAENGARIDARSTQGYTPLMNAASKGHLPIVHYLLARHWPSPFIRNSYNETAYDVAVATFELGIADILATYESRVWQDLQVSASSSIQSRSIKPYNPLGMHITVPIVVYENQRLDLRWVSRTKRTLANPVASTSKLGSAQATPVKFTSSALSRRDGHASSELPPSFDGINKTGGWRPIRRNDIGLPSILNPRQIQLPPNQKNRPVLQRIASSNRSIKSGESFSSTSSNSNAGLKPSHSLPSTPSIPPEAVSAWFWLSSQFFVDLSPSDVDPQQGWQYAQSFNTADADWLDHMPIEVARILAGELPSSTRGGKWVRRRRWARIMRRRLDIPYWGFDDHPEGQTTSEQVADEAADAEQREMELPPVRDYLERAQYFAGSHTRHGRPGACTSSSDARDPSVDEDTRSLRSVRTVIADAQSEEMDRASGRRVIARLERALQELHEGIEDDQDEVRKLQAVTLAEIFEERLESLRQQFPQADGEDDAESFRYPGADDDSELDETSSISTSLRSSSLYSPISHGSPVSFRRSSDALSLPSGSPANRQQAIATTSLSPPPSLRPDLSRHLSSNPDFRVPTSEEPGLSNTTSVHYMPGRPLFTGEYSPTSNVTSQVRSNTRWEPDELTSECRRCSRKFTFFLRKHHCRKCGLVVCAHCSSHHDYLRANEVVAEPGLSNDPLYGIFSSNEGGFYRTCDVCHEDIRTAVSTIDPDLLLSPHYFTSPRHTGHTAMGPTSTTSFNTTTSTAGSTTALPTPTLAHYTQALDDHPTPHAHWREEDVPAIEGADGSPMQRSVSDMSELGECPVCGTNLETIPDKTEQESHIQTCLESGTSSRMQDNRYLVFTLPESSPLAGTDCLICFESYEGGDQIGRLSCLCHFHRHCIANWLSRGKSCPVHGRHDRHVPTQFRLEEHFPHTEFSIQNRLL